MRVVFGFALGLLAMVLPSAVAAGLETLPKCAINCIADGVANSPCAANHTRACTCTNEEYQKRVMTCIMGTCTVTDALSSKNITATYCGAPLRDQAGSFDLVQIILGSISGVIALIRLGFKIFVVRNLSPDDYIFCILALIIAPSITLTHFGTSLNGLGRDIWTLTPQTITNFLFWFYVQIIFYFVNVTLIKLCLVLFYLRIFPGQTVRQLLLGTLIFIVLYGVIFFFIAVFQCLPISLFWNQWEGGHEGKCLTLNAIGWANAIIGVILDFWMLAIPIAEVRKLRLSWRKKIGAALMFCLGTFVTIVSIIRVKALVSVGTSENFTWDNYPAMLWSRLEINCGIICICMPTLRLLLVRLIPALGNNNRAYEDAYRRSRISSGGNKPSSIARMAQGQLDQARTAEDSDSTLGLGGAQSGTTVVSTMGTPATKPHGIICEQTYAVQYDDDEAKLVQMHALDGTGRGLGRA